MFENFPYTDMHQLNLDWIIKIAKDFLEQYTQIQNTITQGLEDLDTKAENLQQLLQEWYDTHSQDIANQLADALQDLNDWYTQHQDFLNEYLESAVESFTAQANQRAQTAISTIPSDYTSLYNQVETIEYAANNSDENKPTKIFTGTDIDTTFSLKWGEWAQKIHYYIPVFNSTSYGTTYALQWVDSDGNNTDIYRIIRGNPTAIDADYILPTNAVAIRIRILPYIDSENTLPITTSITFTNVHEPYTALQNTKDGIIDIGITYDNKYIDATDNGLLKNYDNWKATDFIDVSEIESLHIYTPIAITWAAFFDSNRTFISRIFANNTGDNNITIPNNAKYIRFSTTNENMPNVILYGIITELNDKISNIQQNFTLPDHYKEEIEYTLNDLSKLPHNNFNYVILTDIHYSYPTEFTPYKLGCLMESITRIANSGNIDAVFMLGDIIEGGYNVARSVKDNEINELMESFRYIDKPIMCAYGNHDNGMFNFLNAPTSERTTENYIVINEWMNKVVCPFGFYNDYYYKDFPAKETRVVVANTFDYGEIVDNEGNVTLPNGTSNRVSKTQLDALAEMFYATNYNIVLIAHSFNTDLMELVSIVNTHGTYTKENGSTINYGTKTNIIKMVQVGHYHNAAMEYCSQYHVDIIATSCASMAAAQQAIDGAPNIPYVTSWEDTQPADYLHRTIPRTKGTVNETCFDVVSIGTSETTKIGFGASINKTI